jgi:hypothetical protein
MKPSVNHLLILTLFASQIFLVNCDSSSRKSVRAMMPNSKQNSFVTAPCTEKVMTLIDDRKKIIDDIQKRLDDAKLHDLPADQKQALTKLVDTDLKNKSNEIYDEIRAIKSGSIKAEGCNSATSDGKKATYSIKDIKAENQKLAKQVSDVTKEANSLMDSDSETNNSALIENQSYTLNEDLAKAITKANVESMYVLDGAVHEGSKSSDELKELKDKKDKAFCYLAGTVGELVKTSDELTLKHLHSQESKDKKTVSAQILLTSEADQIETFVCSLAKSSEIPSDLRKVFGDLIVLKNGAVLSEENK